MSSAHTASTPKKQIVLAEGEDVGFGDMLKHISPARKRQSMPSSSKKPQSSLFTSAPKISKTRTKNYGALKNLKFKPGRSKEVPSAFSGMPKGLKLQSSLAKEIHEEASDPLKGMKFMNNRAEEVPNETFDASLAREKNADQRARSCSNKWCNGTVPILMRYKLCERCRKRSRDSSRRRSKQLKEKARAELQRMSSPFKYEEELVLPQDANTLTKEERFKNFMSQLHEAGMLKSCVLGKRKAKDGSVSSTDDSPGAKKPHLDIPEYPTADDMYDALIPAVIATTPMPGSRRAPSLLKFRGCYCVVRDPEDHITRERVEEIVTRAQMETFLYVKCVLTFRLSIRLFLD